MSVSEIAQQLFRRAEKNPAPLTKEDLCRIVGSDDLTGQDYSGADFSNCQLHDVDLSGSDFADTLFHSSSLSNVNMDRCRFTDAEFTAGQFSQVSFNRSDMLCTSFDMQNITNSDFVFVDFISTTWEDVTIRRSRFESGSFGKSSMVNVFFRDKCEINDPMFNECSLFDVIVHDSTIRDADFSECNIVRFKVNHGILSEAVFDGGIITNARFAADYTHFLSLENLTLHDCSFAGEFNESSLTNVEAINLDMSEATGEKINIT